MLLRLGCLTRKEHHLYISFKYLQFHLQLRHYAQRINNSNRHNDSLTSLCDWIFYYFSMFFFSLSTSFGQKSWSNHENSSSGFSKKSCTAGTAYHGALYCQIRVVEPMKYIYTIFMYSLNLMVGVCVFYDTIELSSPFPLN